VRRFLAALGGMAAGGLLALSGLLGTHAASERPAPSSEPLMLDRYCRDRFGSRATVSRSHYLDGWSCSAWRNGVWGLEPVDLGVVCRWQRGSRARLQATGPSQRELACTV
jgi:hypothetical protein